MKNQIAAPTTKRNAIKIVKLSEAVIDITVPAMKNPCAAIWYRTGWHDSYDLCLLNDLHEFACIATPLAKEFEAGEVVVTTPWPLKLDRHGKSPYHDQITIQMKPFFNGLLYAEMRLIPGLNYASRFVFKGVLCTIIDRMPEMDVIESRRAFVEDGEPAVEFVYVANCDNIQAAKRLGLIIEMCELFIFESTQEQTQAA